jgi:hypothetical protein
MYIAAFFKIYKFFIGSACKNINHSSDKKENFGFSETDAGIHLTDILHLSSYFFHSINKNLRRIRDIKPFFFSYDDSNEFPN